MPTDQPTGHHERVVIEVEREGRRPRYHLGARQGGGPVLKPEQCNTDQAAGTINYLDKLPEVSKGSRLQQPWAQLCRRCWGGTVVLELALEAGVGYRRLQAAKREARLARKAARA